MDQTGFYRVSLDFEWVTKESDRFRWFLKGLNGFCTVVLGFTGFYCGLSMVFLVANGSNGFLPSFTIEKRSISLVFKGFKWVLHGCTGFYWVLLWVAGGFHGCKWIKRVFTEFHSILNGLQRKAIDFGGF